VSPQVAGAFSALRRGACRSRRDFEDVEAEKTRREDERTYVCDAVSLTNNSTAAPTFKQKAAAAISNQPF
jgi:hypothetical protein